MSSIPGGSTEDGTCGEGIDRWMVVHGNRVLVDGSCDDRPSPKGGVEGWGAIRIMLLILRGWCLWRVMEGGMTGEQ